MFVTRCPFIVILIQTGGRCTGLGREYEGTIGIYRRNISAARIDIFDAELVAGLPDDVKWIVYNGAEYDLVDVDAYKAKGKC